MEIGGIEGINRKSMGRIVGHQSDELERKVEKWIVESGYALEMKVARRFMREGFSVRQADFYEDPETGKQREIDIWVSKKVSVDGVMFRVNYVIECKKSSKPWVALTSSHQWRDKPHPLNTLHFISRFASLGGTVLLAFHGLTAATDFDNFSNNPEAYPLFSLPERSGHGLTEAFTRGKDLAFNVLNGVVKASTYYARRADRTRDEDGHPSCEIAFPIVVLDGKLFEHYVQDGDLHTQEIKRCLMHWRARNFFRSSSYVHMLTMEGLESVVNDAIATADTLLSNEDGYLDYLAPKLKEDRDMSELYNRFYGDEP